MESRCGVGRGNGVRIGDGAGGRRGIGGREAFKDPCSDGVAGVAFDWLEREAEDGGGDAEDLCGGDVAEGEGWDGDGFKAWLEDDVEGAASGFLGFFVEEINDLG